MILLNNGMLSGIEAAIRGMRNPMNSWNNSDTTYDNDLITIGEKDQKLMLKLVKSGTDHSKFMRFITVTVDITAPMYWWKEFDTYEVGTVRNSCSTMHTITNKAFDASDFSNENLEPCETELLDSIVYFLNINRELYRRDPTNKQAWWNIIQLLPSSYNQKSTVMLNYQVLRNMYHARKNHELTEWRDFCKWCETLPLSELITCKTEE